MFFQNLYCIMKLNLKLFILNLEIVLLLLRQKPLYLYRLIKEQLKYLIFFFNHQIINNNIYFYVHLSLKRSLFVL